ncbi:Photosystem I assembly protein Ycf4 [Bienertia sinuspersici]
MKLHREQDRIIKIELKEGIYTRRVLYQEISSKGAIPLTSMDENLTQQLIEQKASKFNYFLHVPMKYFEIMNGNHESFLYI